MTRAQQAVRRCMEALEIERQNEFAARVGLSKTFINDLMQGREVCGRRGALKIMDLFAEGEAPCSAEELMSDAPAREAVA